MFLHLGGVGFFFLFQGEYYVCMYVCTYVCVCVCVCLCSINYVCRRGAYKNIHLKSKYVYVMRKSMYRRYCICTDT